MLEGLLESLSPLNIGLVLLGTLIGIIAGALPGLGPTLSVSLLIPFTYGMSSTTALILMGGIYVGAVYGGSITSILLGIPGTPNSTATVFDGFPMAQQGKALQALGASTTASAVGGLISALCLMFFTPMLSRVVMKFGVAEQFILAIFGLSVIAISSREHFIKGLLSGFFGLAIATIGYNPITGLDRFVFGTVWLSDGIPFMSAVIGLFGVAQTFKLAENACNIAGGEKVTGSLWEGIKSVFKHPVVTLHATVLGLFFGAVPGVGGGPANLISYSSISSAAKDRNTFGKGNVKGVIAAEASNNATVGTALIPTLAFGIPGSAVCAIVMGLLTMHGIDVGPRLFTNIPVTLYTFFWGFLFANIALVLIALPLMRYFAKLTILPYQILVPNILVLCVLGSYSLRGSFLDIIITLAFGVLGYFMRKAKFPMIGIVLGLVLGRMAEANLSRSLLIHKGWSFLYTRPITLAILILTALIIIIPNLNLKKIVAKRKAKA